MELALNTNALRSENGRTFEASAPMSHGDKSSESQNATFVGKNARELMMFFGSKPDWGFFVHGAACRAVRLACREAGVRFSPQHEKVEKPSEA